MARTRVLLANFVLERFCDRGELLLIVRAKVNVRVKWSQVNSAFWCTLRKTTNAEWNRKWIKGTGEEYPAGARHHGTFLHAANWRMKSGRVGSRNLHRTCTGNAEWQASGLRLQTSGFRWEGL